MAATKKEHTDLLGLEQLGGPPPDQMSAMMSAPPPPPEAPPADDEDPWSMVMEAVRAAAQADGTVTPQENVIVEKITSLIAQLQAGRDKEEQAALGGGPATNFLRRNSG